MIVEAFVWTSLWLVPFWVSLRSAGRVICLCLLNIVVYLFELVGPLHSILCFFFCLHLPKCLTCTLLNYVGPKLHSSTEGEDVHGLSENLRFRWTLDEVESDPHENEKQITVSFTIVTSANELFARYVWVVNKMWIHCSIIADIKCLQTRPVCS